MLIDPEAEALELYRAARMDPASPPGAHVLARALLGEDCLRSSPTQGRTFLRCEQDRWHIYLTRRALRETGLNFLIAHEIGEWHLRSYDGEDRERLADQIAAALVAPAPAIRAALRACGDDLPEMREAFCGSEWLLSLRVAEVTGRPRACIGPDKVRVRGESFEWPSEAEMRRIAARPPPGIICRPLTDRPGSIALIPES